MKVFVTGAGGFVGRHLVKALERAGHEVVACSRDLSPGLGTAFEKFDIGDAKATKEALSRHNPGGVVHLAAQASVRESWLRPDETYRTNVVGAGNLLHALKDRPETRVLLVGSAQQYGSTRYERPLVESDALKGASPYAFSKIAQELIGKLCRESFGLNVLMSRAFNHTGPGQSSEYAVGSFCRQIAGIEAGAESVMKVGRLDAVRDFLDVRDVVESYRLLLESGRPGEAYNVASGEGRRIGDLLEAVLELAALDSAPQIVSTAGRHSGDPDVLIGDSSKLRSETGWRPTITIEESLKDTLAWHRESLVKTPNPRNQVESP